MVTVIKSEHRPSYREALNAMHRHRKQVFVDFLKWDVPVVDGQYEIDQFDTEAAIYLMAIDPRTQSHLGSVRLLPSTGPHLLRDLFPHLCAESVPVAADIWEITRLCTAPKAAEPKRVLEQLATAVMEFGLLYGVKQFTCVAHLAWLNQILAAGWECEPLGLPQIIDGEHVGAVVIKVSTQSLQILRERLKFTQPLLRIPEVSRAA